MRKLLLPVVCGLLGFTLSARAIPTLTLTEESNAVLSWSFSGLSPGNDTLNFVSTDHWEGLIPNPTGLVVFGVFSVSWREPAGEDGVNLVTFSLDTESRMEVTVASGVTGVSPNADGDTVILPAGFQVRFIDLGDEPVFDVPDDVSSLGILLISLVGLAFYRGIQFPLAPHILLNKKA